MGSSTKHIADIDCNDSFRNRHFIKSRQDEWLVVDKRPMREFHKDRRLDSDYEWGVKKKAASRANEIKERFNELAIKWEDETGLYSTMVPKITNRWYLKIIAMGERVVPFILEKMNSPYGTSHWHTALVALTGVNPIPENLQGNNKVIKEIWINWGVDNNKI